MLMRNLVRFTACAVLVAHLAGSASAHFPWIARSSEGEVLYFFGETPADRTYHLPESIAAAKLQLHVPGKPARNLSVQPAETDTYVGLRSQPKVSPQAWVSSQVTFGMYHDTQLEYYTLNLGESLPASQKAYLPLQQELKLCAALVQTQQGVACTVTFAGSPVADAVVTLFCEEGHAEAEATTDAAGKVTFSSSEVEAGLNGIMVGHNEAADRAAGRPETSHYLTVTFQAPSPSEPKKDKQLTGFADLPDAITSFGAARLDEGIFVYGGHIGSAHSYSVKEQSNRLMRLDLAKPESPWQEIATGDRLQGLAMVADQDRLILIGGFSALNQEGEDHDLHSLTTVKAFDVQGGRWHDLPSLPTGRSSHDAAIIGQKIYVVGGWTMDGEKDTQWHTSALVLDLAADSPQWTEIAQPPFQRRALAVVAHQGKIYTIGGMNQKGGPTRQVAVYDPSDNAWSTAGELAGDEAMIGFGASAWSTAGQLIATTYNGDIQRLNANGDTWEVIGKTADARFFHRLLPLDGGRLLAVGGANMESGKFHTPEAVSAGK